MSDFIPDPDAPTLRAISPEDGELVYGVYMGPANPDGSHPTLQDIENMTFIGWTKGFGK